MPSHTETEFLGPVDRGGRLAARVRLTIAAEIASYAGGPVRIVVGPLRRRLTGRQRGYYFPKVVETYAEFAGYTKQEAHVAFKLALLGLEPAEGRKLPRVRSITRLTPVEFRDYVDDCRRIAAEMGCETPDPDPLWRTRGYLTEHQGIQQ